MDRNLFFLISLFLPTAAALEPFNVVQHIASLTSVIKIINNDYLVDVATASTMIKKKRLKCIKKRLTDVV